MKISPLLSTLTLAAFGVSYAAQTPAPAALSQGTLFQTNFETGNGWTNIKPSAVGTIYVSGSTQPSQGLTSRNAIASGPLCAEKQRNQLGQTDAGV